MEYLENHSSKAIDQLCFAAEDNGDTQENLFNGTMNHFVTDQGIIARLVGLETLEYIRLISIKFTAEECKALSTILSSEGCKIETLWLERGCRFIGHGRQLVCAALATNTSIDGLHSDDMGQDKSFCDELVNTLPMNRRIRFVYFEGSSSPTATENLDIVELIKNVARRNDSIVQMRFQGAYFTLNESDMQEVQQELQQSYSLKKIQIGDSAHFETITRLNRAGRRYLSEDSTNNSKCIAVLSKVKHNLDCLYYHIRENPILCISAGGEMQAQMKAQIQALKEKYEYFVSVPIKEGKLNIRVGFPHVHSDEKTEAGYPLVVGYTGSSDCFANAKAKCGDRIIGIVAKGINNRLKYTTRTEAIVALEVTAFRTHVHTHMTRLYVNPYFNQL